LDNHAATWVSADTYEIKPDATRFENWEDYVAGKIGFAAALDYALNWGVENTHARLMELATSLRMQLDARKKIMVRDLGAEKCGIVTFTVDGLDSVTIQNELALKNINITHSTRFSSRLDMDARDLDSVVRASVHYYNTDDEIRQFMAALDALIANAG
jgi:selenocysteine lyase/cysteine desulfurase